ncbi:hypothetical protein EWM64_g3760 [Hericium alpestre]|uniref:DUF1771 domain-containing protein n=1 Tax=Hericium alpestre TaxID=135208 RepID=A0A4Z0A1P0_9AGAM|nr:hypothetical protein EWM64_g3760 [Hericium alpestre]
MPGPLIAAGLIVGVGLFLYSLFKSDDKTPSSIDERYAPPTRASYRRDPVFVRARSQPRADNGIDQRTSSLLRPRAAQVPPATQGIYTPDADENDQSDAHYTSLRARAVTAGDEMARAYAESQVAWDEGRRARAKELSNEGKVKRAEMVRLNDEAGAWAFRKNNTDRAPGEVDLHDLYVKEAVKYADQSIQKARRHGNSEIRLIVGV